jgi:hypothetical protein
VSAGREGEHLLAVVRELYRELGYDEASEGPKKAWLQSSQAELWERRETPGDELADLLREALAKLACAADGEGTERKERAVSAALDGAELVMRCEIAAGRPAAIADHLPGFVYMVTLPGLGRKGALAVSRRAAELVEDAPP